MIDTRQPRIDRRSLVVGALATATVASVLPGRTFAQSDKDKANQEDAADMRIRRQRFEELGYFWQATSPSTHEGDTLTAIFTNRASATITIWPSIIIMDHPNHHNEAVVDEEFELPAGEARTFTVRNDYGVANHFSTRMLAATGDPGTLGIEIAIVDSAGNPTAQFNERAFWIKTFEEMQTKHDAEMPSESEAGEHDHV